jgi:RHS repeat-associated protein
VHQPSGTVIKDDDGHVVRTVSISPIPVDRPPFPLPKNSDVPIYFTIQPGGAYIAGDWADPRRGAWLVYPNYRHEFPGKRIQFYQYDPEQIGWHVYGVGTVTPNGTQVTPDPTTRLWAFTGAMINSGPAPPADGAPPGDCPSCANGGDPVNLTTGLFSLDQTDLALPDTLPIAVTRTYRSRDLEVRPFGPGTTYPYAMFLWSAHQYTEADLVLPDGAKIHYVRTSGGVSFADAVFQHVETDTTSATPTAFYKSTIVWNGDGWNLTLLDGTVYVFGENAPLQAIRDKFGNTITIAHAAGQTGNVTQVTSPHGRWIAFTYGEDANCATCISHITDNIGRTVHYAYDTSGNLWKVTDPLGHVTEYTYDSNHNMLTVKNRNGVVYVTNEYTTAADAPTPIGWVKIQTHADTGVYHFAYTVANGKSTQTDVTDPRGFVRRVTFNADGYTLTDTRAYGQPDAQTTSWDRPNTNNFIKTATDSLNAQTVYARDALGNVTAVTRCLPNQSPCTDGSPGALTTRYTYEPHFQQLATVIDPLQHTTTYGFDAAGNLTSVTDPLQHQSTFAYNAAGQLTSTTDGLQHSTTFGYTGGDLITVTDPLDRVTTRFTDAAGRVLAITDPAGQTTRYTYDANDEVSTAADALGGQTAFAYFPDGQLKSITDANEHTTSYAYDAMGRMSSRTDPLQRTESFTYDLDGNPAQWTDRKGQVTTRAYDALDRPHQITYNDASTVTYSYDTRNRLTLIADTASGSISRTYDDFDRLTSETTPQGSISYTYDDGDRRASMTVAGQSSVVYSYDDADRLTGLTRGTQVISVTFDDANRRTTLTLPNGIVTQYRYDDANQLTSLTYQSGANTLGDLMYTYDSAGRRSQIGGSWARTGLPQAVASAVYDAANELTMWEGVARQYDPNGSLVSDGLTSYVWNARNQLVTVNGNISGSFGYDAIARRASKTLSGTTTGSLFDGGNVVQELVSGTPSVNLLTGTQLDETFTRTDSNGTAGLLADALGSTVAVTDPTARVQTEYTFEPFGRATTSGVADSNAAEFTGRENDSTGLYSYRARYYEPSAARFVSEDILDFAAGPNLYAYVGDRPLDLTDPTGLSERSVRCDSIRRSIENLKTTIEDKEQEYDENKLDLPEECVGDWDNPRLSRRGHREEISKYKYQLAVYEILYQLFCIDPPIPQVPRLVPPRIPPIPPPTPQQTTVMVGAGSLAAYWWLVFVLGG